MASRMYEAIEQMRADGSESPYLVKVANECLRLLGQLEQDKTGDANDIVRAIGTPPAKQLFKNIDGTTVKPANRRDVQARLPAHAPQLKTATGTAPGGDNAAPGTKPKGDAPPNPFAPIEAKPGTPQPPGTPPPPKGDGKPPPPPPGKP
jgi:hypothetical protein